MSPQTFPHLNLSESAIWVAFLAKYGPLWDRFDYDVRVGQGHPIDPNVADFIQTMWRKVTPKRIDAVGWKDGQPTIFEVTPKASTGTYGHLPLYRHLFTVQYPDLPVPALAYVVPRIDRDARSYLEAEGVTIYLVDAAVPA